MFIDTSYIIALEAVDDQNHLRAQEHWQQLIVSIPPLVTTSYIFDEVVTFFNTKNRHAKAVELGNLLLTSPSIKMIQID
jgi:predicted nucleic acid-binding protein